jgi:hypothetical protein
MDMLALTIVIVFFITCWGLLAICQNLMEAK